MSLRTLMEAKREAKRLHHERQMELLNKSKIECMDFLYERYIANSHRTKLNFNMSDFIDYINAKRILLVDEGILDLNKEQYSDFPDLIWTDFDDEPNTSLSPKFLSVSMVKSTTKTNIKYNNREMTEKQKAKHPHIDYTKSHENNYLVKKDIQAVYHEEFDEALDTYNAKQKRKDRQIKDYYKHVKVGKRTALQHEIVVQLANDENFEFDIETKKDVNLILMQWFESFQKRNPQLKVFNAVIHNDEVNPHMHINIVPVATGYTNGLSKQISFDRAILNQNPDLDKTRTFADWRSIEVDEIEKIMNAYGYICNKDKFNQVHTNPKS